MTTYAVTGATGHYGHKVVETLLDNSVAASDIVALVRNTDKAADLAARGVEIRELDYATITDKTVFEGIDRLLFVPSSSFAGRGPENKNVISLAAQAGVDYLIYLSFINAPEFPGNPLNPDHAETEAAIDQISGDMKVLSLRSGYYYENFLGNVQGGLATGHIFSASQDGLISQAAREDMAEGAAKLLLDAAPRTGVITFAAQSLTKGQMVEAVAAAVGKPIDLVEVAPEQLRAGMVSAGMPEPVADVFTAVDVETRSGALESDSTVLADVLGREPQTFAAFIAEQLAQ